LVASFIIAPIAVKTYWRLPDPATARRNAAILADFQERGARLVSQTLDNGLPLPQEAADKWAGEVEAYLATLGPTYVPRFRSDAGLPIPGTPTGIQSNRLGFLQALKYRMARLDQFSSEIQR
jgi:hypothetical protein